MAAVYGKRVEAVGPEGFDEDPQQPQPSKASKPKKGEQQWGIANDADDLELGAVGNEADGEVRCQLPPQIRAGFIRKVYGILTAQMTFTVLFVASCMLMKPLRLAILEFYKSYPPVLICLMFANMGVICALMKFKDQHPLNYQLLSAFTVLTALPLGIVCAAYYSAGLGVLVLEAFLLTAVCFASLTAYAIYSGQDFSWMGGMLFAGMMIMMAWGLLGSIFGFGGGMLMSACGALLFCGFIVYDTHRVMEVYGPDDAIVASIELYLDIVNLFMYLLDLLSAMGSNES